MQKRIKRINLITLVFTIVEVALIGVFMTLYLLNVGGLFDVILPEYIIYGSCIVVFANMFFVWGAIYSVYRTRQKSDIRTAEVIGNDIQEAYNFGKLGFLVIDSKNTVIWQSDVLSGRGFNLMNENIYSAYPELDKFNNADISEIKLHINNVYYVVKYLKSAGVFIFRDDTEFENLYHQTADDAICIGLINIDNYNDVTSTSEDDTENIIRIRTIITEYAKEYRVLLREIRSDSYFAICSHQSLDLMRNNSFSLLDKVRQVPFGSSSRATLSIGFAHGFPDANKLNDMASSAIEIAMSRGGDQAVVSSYGNELEYYGGKTEAVENTSKVKIRVFTNSLITLIKGSSNVLIMGHTNTDMDALGSCLGIKAICDYCKIESYVVFDQKQSEKKTRSAALTKINEYNKIFKDSKEAKEKCGPKTLIVVCDTSVPQNTICPEILEDNERVVVIDHHRRGEKFIEKPVLNMIDPSASSASELVVSMIKYNSEKDEIPLRKDFATVMLSGIFLDTNFYKSKTVGLRTFESSMILRDFGADNSAASDLLKEEEEDYLMISKFIERKKSPYYGVSYCMGEEDEIYEQATFAKVGNQCMALRGCTAVFVLGKVNNNDVGISARSDGSINVQILCEKFPDGGGGHLTQAGARVKNSTIEKAEQLLLEILDKNLNIARNAKEAEGE